MVGDEEVVVNPHFPALRSDPTALSGASRRKQIPSSNPGEFNAGITGVTRSGNTITFTHPHNANPPSDITGYYQWSPNLVDWYAGDGVAGPPGGPTVTITSSSGGSTTNVTATTPIALERVFLRACVQQE